MHGMVSMSKVGGKCHKKLIQIIVCKVELREKMQKYKVYTRENEGSEIPVGVTLLSACCAWVWRLTCSPILVLCFRISSSFSLTLKARVRQASGVGGSHWWGGRARVASTVVSLVVVGERMNLRQMIVKDRATRRRNGIPAASGINIGE
jgi:hypothetical protein